jgi:hypothetical protein
MTRHRYTAFDPLLSAEQAAEMIVLCERYGSYGTYAEEPTFAGIGEGLPARYDAVRNFIKTGGRFGRSEPLHKLAARTNYFRETYAYGREIRADGIQPFLHHEGFVEAARQLHGRPLIEPAIVFANLLVPGQELAVHTDVPEFRGVSRKTHPQWLCVAMHHSGLFDDWRMPIATGVSWFHDCDGGEFAFYPDGPQAPPVALKVRYNTAILLDTDSVFHGVDRVKETTAPIDVLRPGMRLVAEGSGRWRLVDGEQTLARYHWRELRFSVSWKAYCFRDEEEKRAWSDHSDDLRVDFVLERMLADLRGRGRLEGEVPSGQALAELLIDEYVHYPEPRADA